jgi:hypothetical protein
VVHAKALDLVQWEKYAGKEELVLFFEWQSEPVDDRSQYLKQFGNTIKTFCFVYELEENVVYRSTNIGAEVEKFAIDAMKGCFQEVPLPRILRVKQLKELDMSITKREKDNPKDSHSARNYDQYTPWRYLC